MNIIGYTGDECWAALRLAAEETYKSEVIDTEMAHLIHDEWFTKDDWIADKISDWLSRANKDE